ncbi:MAG: LacI family DNA-binding transcriptional regulator [Lawsonibacter sp.]|jgi:LacI family transcriptional regulator
MTIKELSDLAGVSTATVSRAFKENSDINAETRKHILALAEQVGYRPKQYVLRKRTARKNLTVGVVLDCGSYPFSNVVLTGICNAMNAEGVTVLCANSQDDPQQSILCLDRMRDLVDGLIVVPATEQNDYNIQFLEEINRSIPVLTLIRSTNLNHIDTVRVDNYTPTYNAISLLIDHGHEHIAIINGPMKIKPSHDKLTAYAAAMSDHNLPIRSEYICYGEFDEQKICDLTIDLITRFPAITALVTANTTITRGCLKALDELNLQIPDDIAIISYGNDFCFSLRPLHITAIADPHIVMGQQAAQLLLQRIRTRKHNKKRPPERIIISSELIIRGSEIFPKNRLSERRKPTPF